MQHYPKLTIIFQLFQIPQKIISPLISNTNLVLSKSRASLMKRKPRGGLLRTPFFVTVLFLINLLIQRIITLVPQTLTIDPNYLGQRRAYLVQARSESLPSESLGLWAESRVIVSVWHENIISVSSHVSQSVEKDSLR